MHLDEDVTRKCDHPKVVDHQELAEFHRWSLVHEAWEGDLDNVDVSETDDKARQRTGHHEIVLYAWIYKCDQLINQPTRNTVNILIRVLQHIMCSIKQQPKLVNG